MVKVFYSLEEAEAAASPGDTIYSRHISFHPFIEYAVGGDPAPELDDDEWEIEN